MPTLDVPLSTVMTRDVVTVLSTATVEQAVRAMLEQNVLGLAVEDAAGSVVGVFSMTDALVATSTSVALTSPRGVTSRKPRAVG